MGLGIALGGAMKGLESAERAKLGQDTLALQRDQFASNEKLAQQRLGLEAQRLQMDQSAQAQGQLDALTSQGVAAAKMVLESGGTPEAKSAALKAIFEPIVEVNPNAASTFQQLDAIASMPVNSAPALPEPSTTETKSFVDAGAAYASAMKGLDDFEGLTKKYGASWLPGTKEIRDYRTVRRDLQLQLKELYNLGVLNGPDLDLMNEVLIDPESMTNMVGFQAKAAENIQNLRRMLTNKLNAKKAAYYRSDPNLKPGDVPVPKSKDTKETQPPPPSGFSIVGG